MAAMVASVPVLTNLSCSMLG
jgi:hypothetical protein